MKKALCLLFTVFMLMSICMNVSAAGFLDKIGELADEYLPDDIKEEVKSYISFEYEDIEKAIQAVLTSKWYSSASKEDRIEKISSVLESFGIEDSDIIADTVEDILSFEFNGQKIGIMLENYSEDLFSSEFWGDDDYSPEYDVKLSEKKNAIIMYGLGFPEIEAKLRLTAEGWSGEGLKTKLDDFCTVEDFKTELSNKDFIVISEHGNADYLGTPMICTEDPYNDESYNDYYDDIYYGRIYPVLTENGTFYWIHPSFFTYYYGEDGLNGSYIWISSCQGCKYNDLTDALLNCGADGILGHSETVYCAYDYRMMNTVIDRMLVGDDSNTAVKSAITKWGDNDNDFMVDVLGYNRSQLKYEVAYPCPSGEADWVD